ncbi:MAG: formate dehydrogenase subunit delta [Alphaproteobacteria bacterium]
MKPETLVRMANQIATFFRSRPEEQAIAATAEHLVMFWDPRMRAELAQHVSAGGAGLDAIALAAARRIAPQEAPAP